MRKRLIYRCDDVGYTEAYDLGLFRVIDEGIGCSADVMFDAEHAAEALKWIKERPWISFGWHRHLWERPVLPASEVPSLVNEQGRFKWGHRRNELKAEATYEDAYKEFKAEMELCYSIMGRYPDVAGTQPESELPLEKAFCDVVRECGIHENVFSTAPGHRMSRKANPEYAHLNIVSAGIANGNAYDYSKWDQYRPLENMTALEWTDKEEIYFYGYHPGYCDDHILAESTCNIHRVRELQCALSDEYKQWIIDNKIELVNFRDAINGTSEFQDHLKEIGSPLWIGNFR